MRKRAIEAKANITEDCLRSIKLVLEKTLIENESLRKKLEAVSIENNDLRREIEDAHKRRKCAEASLKVAESEVFRLNGVVDIEQAEIERLKDSRDRWKRNALSFDEASRETEKELEKLYAEIEELEAEYEKVYEQAEADILGNLPQGGASCHWCIDKHKEYIIKEFAEKVDEILKRYAHLHKYAEKARHSTEEYADGTPMEMVSVWEVLSLKKWEMCDYETMSTLQDNIETIEKARLLSELEKDFMLLKKEMVGDAE